MLGLKKVWSRKFRVWVPIFAMHTSQNALGRYVMTRVLQAQAVSRGELYLKPIPESSAI